MGKVIILTKEEVDAGKAPPHTSCIPYDDGSGIDKFLFSGKTGKAGRAKTDDDAELKAELSAKQVEKQRKEHDKAAAKAEKQQAKHNAPKPKVTQPGQKRKESDVEPDAEPLEAESDEAETE